MTPPPPPPGTRVPAQRAAGARRPGPRGPPRTPPLASPGTWVLDRRGGGRGVRVSAHTEGGFLVLSTWKSDVCAATVRLLPDEAAQLVAGIADALAQLSTPRPAAPDELTQRLAALETRVVVLEQATPPDSSPA